MVGFLFLSLFTSWAGAIDEPSVRIFDLNDFPDFEYSDIIEIYYLEASFPFTTPSSIVDQSGDQWTQYSLSHSGLGIWNKERHLKISIELVCEDYIGALLPAILSISPPSLLQTIVWNNSAQVVLTKPINETFWAESRLLAVSNGGAYKGLVQYLKDHQKRYSTYQPVTIVQDMTNIVQVAAKDSYSFVEDLFNELVDYRLTLSTFLQIKRSYFSYLTVPSASVIKISWTGMAPPNVTQWYSNLTLCYKQLWNDNDAGAAVFLVLVRSCYSSGYAFVYDTDSSVYQVQLSSDLSPSFYRRELELPEVSDSKSSRWDVTDSVITSLFVLLFFFGLLFCIYQLFEKKKRRPGEFKDDEDVSNIVDEIIRARNPAYQPRSAKLSNDEPDLRPEINSLTKRDTLYQYFNRRSEQQEQNRTKSSIFSIFPSLSGGKSLLPNNSVSDHYTAYQPPTTEESPSQFSPSSTPHSSIPLSHSTTSSQQQQQQQQPSTSQWNSPTPPLSSSQPVGLTSTSDDFLNFIQQPTTRIVSTNERSGGGGGGGGRRSPSLLYPNDREKSLSDETGEEGVRLSSPPLRGMGNSGKSSDENLLHY